MIIIFKLGFVDCFLEVVWFFIWIDEFMWYEVFYMEDSVFCSFGNSIKSKWNLSFFNWRVIFMFWVEWNMFIIKYIVFS